MKPQNAIDDSALAPETNVVVAEALRLLEKEIQAARAINDPLVHPLKALAATVYSLHRLFVDGTQALKGAQQAPPVLTPAAERELLDRLAQEGWKAVKGATWEAHRQMNWQLAVTVGAAVAALLLVTGLGGYWTGWWQRGRADVAGLSTEMCRIGEAISSQDGELKGCVVWLGATPPQQRQHPELP
jgi:hypothetical protein